MGRRQSVLKLNFVREQKPASAYLVELPGLSPVTPTRTNVATPETQHHYPTHLHIDTQINRLSALRSTLTTDTHDTTCINVICAVPTSPFQYFPCDMLCLCSVRFSPICCDFLSNHLSSCHIHNCFKCPSLASHHRLSRHRTCITLLYPVLSQRQREFQREYSHSSTAFAVAKLPLGS